MTHRFGPVASWTRWRRVYEESGIVGLLLRAAARGLKVFARAVDSVADGLILDVPLRWMTPRAIARQLRPLRALEGRHSGETIFILGTGPSLRSLDPSLLEGRTSVIVNQGFLYAREVGLAPTYLAVIDDMYRDQHRMLDGLAQFCRDKNVEVLCSTSIKEALEARPEPPRCHGFHLIMRSRYYEETGRSLPLDLTAAQPGYESVIHFAIAIALAMGAREIVLLGCDMTYFANPKQLYRHSYSEGAYIPDTKTADELFRMDQVELLELGHAEFRSFRTLRRMAEARGARILNATDGGYLEVFERADLASLVAKSPPTELPCRQTPETSTGRHPS
jgi:hypothetical protein